MFLDEFKQVLSNIFEKDARIKYFEMYNNVPSHFIEIEVYWRVPNKDSYKNSLRISYTEYENTPANVMIKNTFDRLQRDFEKTILGVD